MKQQGFSLTPLVVAIWVLFNIQPVNAEHVVADNQSAKKQGSSLPEIKVIKKRSRSEIGKNRVYTREIANVYIDKTDLDHYRGTSIGDLLKGANGVYGGDTRNSGALDANIRGIQGQGRVPITVDGTEQSVATFLGSMGTAGRTYLDPNIIGGIAIEKGPSLSRGVKSGVGGAVFATTLEADDVLLPGHKYGVDLKIDTGTNSVRQHKLADDYWGRDYRDFPGMTMFGQRAQGRIENAHSVARQGKTWNFNGQDHSARLATAYSGEVLEAVAAYSYRKRGNYFAGKGGSKNYMMDDWTKIAGAAEIRAMDNDNYAYLANVFYPGKEVGNTNSDLRSLLLKTTIKLPDNQKLKLGYLNTEHTFGESIPWYANLLVKWSDMPQNKKRIQNIIINIPESKIKNNTYNLQYSWKPENNRWIDLEAGVWRTKHQSWRHQNGEFPWGIVGDLSGGIWQAKGDVQWDQWTKYFDNPLFYFSEDGVNLREDMWQANCAHLSADNPPKKLPNIDGRYNIIPVALQIDTDTRWGINLSNRFAFSDNLALMLSGDMQHEKLVGTQNEKIRNTEFNAGSRYFGARSGTRREYRLSAVVDWQPTNWLSLTAGGTYNRYWSFDDKLAYERRKGAAGADMTPGNEVYKIGHKQTHSYINYLMMGNKEDAKSQITIDAYHKRLTEMANDGTYTTEKAKKTPTEQAAHDYQIERGRELAAGGQYSAGLSSLLKPYLQAEIGWDGAYTNEPKMRTIVDKKNGNKLYYWAINELAPWTEGKSYPLKKDNPFLNGKINTSEIVHNPHGVEGDYLKYLSQMVVAKGILDRLPTIEEINTFATQFAENVRVIDNITPIEDPWAQPKKRKNHAFAPMIAATISLTDNIRIYGRYSEAVRFPNIYEDTQATTGFSAGALTNLSLVKPEHAKNWEIGYIHDLTSFFPSLHHADIKLNYYDNTIHNYIDKSYRHNILQFAKKITTGVELQTRVDSGRYFADMGVTYRLKNKMCDADYAASQDIYYARKYDECVTAGFPYTFSYMALQPKYSINLNGGLRLMDDKLIIGGRAVYHSEAKNKDADKWRANLNRQAGTTGYLSPFKWNPILVFDAYVDYAINKNVKLNFGIENITNRYYADPLTRVPQPAPGRSMRVGLSAQF